eukprot:1177781-Prorocentrum_minimum.AAC.3
MPHRKKVRALNICSDRAHLVHEQRVGPLAHVRPVRRPVRGVSDPLEVDVRLALPAHHRDLLDVHQAAHNLPALVWVALPVQRHVAQNLRGKRCVHWHLEQTQDELREAQGALVRERLAVDDPPTPIQPLDRLGLKIIPPA